MNDQPAVTPPRPLRARIELVDALRGSALLGILLMHSFEHWDFMRYPKDSPAWLQTLDQWTTNADYFFFAGKAYAIFALLFGVSFFMILERWSERGINFGGRFLWRLTVLGIFGYLHGLIYCGDILLVIALLGVPLLALHRCSTKTLAWISLLLVLQLPSLWETGQVLLNPNLEPRQPIHWGIYGQIDKVYADGSFRDVISTNLWQGQLVRLWWTVETGRYTQMLGLFVWGLLLGRSRVFEDRSRSIKLAKHALAWGLVGFAITYPIKLHLGEWGLKDMRLYTVDNLVSAYCNLAQMAIWVGGFILIYQWRKVAGALRLLAPYGRTSLTCYVTQGLIGVPLFYGFGFALYRTLGPFFSVLVGVAIFSIQSVAVRLWLKQFTYGPLEWLWRACTLGSSKVSPRATAAKP